MNETPLLSAAIARYTQFYENLSPETLEDINQICIEDVYFRDPFNELYNRDQLKRVFKDMFSQCDDHNFTVLTAYSDPLRHPNAFVLKWFFEATVPKIGKLDFIGLSEVQINEDGLITSHIDYWDSGSYFYMKIPLIKQILGIIKNRLRIT
jgi:steroid delta-isomerase